MAGNVQKFGFLKIHSQNRVGEVQSYASKSLFFEGETFFQRPLENFLCVVWPCSIYLEVCLRSYLYARKKLGSYDTSNRLYGRKRNKSLDFEKFTLRIGLVKYRAMLQKAYFWRQFFFQTPLENFLCVVWPCSIYLEVCLRSYLYARKKIGVIRHTNQKISMKTRFTLEKKPVVRDFPSDHCNK